jgi:putative membrane protein
MATQVHALDSNALAMERTWLAHERTLMAWVRTAASMISFGFTIYKFFDFEQASTHARTVGVFTPRIFAIFLVAIGLVTLVLATLGHHRDTKELHSQLPSPRYSLAELVAGLIAVFGIMVLVSAILRD